MGNCSGVPLNPYYPRNFETPSAKATLDVRRILMIVNASKHSRSSSFIAGVLEVADANDVAVEYQASTYAGHVFEIVQTASFDGIDVLVPVGGDGTVHEVVNAMLAREDRRKVPIGIISAGSGNNIAYDLGLPMKANQAMAAICGGFTRAMDVQAVSPARESSGTDSGVVPGGGAAGGPVSKYSINICGWGAPTRILQEADSHRLFGKALYDLATLKVIMEFALKLAVRIVMYDARPYFPEEQNNSAPLQPVMVLQGNYALVQSMVNIHTSTRLPLQPQAISDDGFVDLILIKFEEGMTRGQFIAVFDESKKAAHLREDNDLVSFYRCRSYEVHPEASVGDRLLGEDTVNIDGELAASAPYHVTTLPRMLEFIAGSEEDLVVPRSGKTATCWGD